MERKLEEWAKSPEYEAYCEKIGKQYELQLKRFAKFEEWLKYNDFDKLIQRLISEHDDKYHEKCYNKGYQPYPNNKLSFLVDYVVHKFEPIKVTELNCNFSNEIWFYKGYYFQMVYGQGVLTNIYDKETMELILQI